MQVYARSCSLHVTPTPVSLKQLCEGPVFRFRVQFGVLQWPLQLPDCAKPFKTSHEQVMHSVLAICVTTLTDDSLMSVSSRG